MLCGSPPARLSGQGDANHSPTGQRRPDVTLSFTNQSRSYDATRQAVRFWGYDGALEVSFFVRPPASMHGAGRGRTKSEPTTSDARRDAATTTLSPAQPCGNPAQNARATSQTGIPVWDVFGSFPCGPKR